MNRGKVNFRDNKILLFYGCFFLVALVVHFLLPLGWADDAVFYEKTLKLGLSDFLSNSARPFVDMFTYIFVKYPILWRIINPVMLVASSFLLSTYLPQSINEYVKNIVICIAMLYPSMVVVDAGFVATTLNYLWPVTFGLLCLLPTYRRITGRKCSFIEMLFLVPCLLYATNMQQMAVVLVVLFGIANVYLIYKKDFSLYILLQFLITAACSVYSYLINTVGDNPRMLREIGRYFPEFGSLSLLEKMELGFSSTFYCLTMEHRLAWFGFFAFLCVLAFWMYKKSEKILNRVIVSFPVIFSVLGIIESFCSEKFIPGELQNYGLNKAEYSFDIISDALFVIIILCILYSLFVLIENKATYIISCFVFFLGLGSRMLMGFSPTVWASGYRTFYIMFVSFVIIAFLIINENQKINKKSPQILC